MMALQVRATPRVQAAMPISTPSAAHRQKATEIHSSASWGASPRVPSTFKGTPISATLPSSKFYQFVLFVISLWILQVVLKFWRYLSAVDPARARILASPRRRHAASQAAHNERAVRRLESGASD